MTAALRAMDNVILRRGHEDGSISPANKLTYIRTLWASALVVSFLLSVLAAFRGGYVGPDYNMHLSRLLDSSKIFDFSETSPPTYYLLGHALLLVIGSNNAFPITLSIAQVAINVLAMWWFFLYTERRFKSPLIHFDEFRTDVTATHQSAALFGLALGAAVWVKYIFMSLIPTLFVVFIFLW